MEVPQKLKIKLPYDPAIPLLGIYPDKTIIQATTAVPGLSAKAPPWPVLYSPYKDGGAGLL